jgi:hypothetical protein
MPTTPPTGNEKAAKECRSGARIAAGRQSIGVVALEGILDIAPEGRLHFRVLAHLHRYPLLGVDGRLPRPISSPSRDPLSGNPVCDVHDGERSVL